ncbi:MAG: maleylpyruvate isomerase N-terminal domain-containing protein [Mycobacteriales bacterium]
MAAAGMSDHGAAEVGGYVLDAWDAFLDVVTDPRTDLSRPSRLPGWTGHDVVAHLGQWPGHDIVEGVLAASRTEGPRPLDRDATNAALVQQHRASSQDEIVAALVRARDSLDDFFASPRADELGHAWAESDVGRLPVLSLLHASTYELAVHALDLMPCGAPAPPDALLDRGLAALMDVTGSLCARSGIDITLTAQTPEGGWQFVSDPAGWSTQRTSAGKISGTGASATAADLLDTSAGRTNLAQLLVTRRLVVHQLPSFMRLAPLLQDVPGLPGGPALRKAVAGLGGVTRVFGRLRRP